MKSETSLRRGIRRRNHGPCGLLLGVVTLASVALSAQSSKSAPLARELASLMAGRHLDVYAVRDPDSPKKFIAALLIPEVELLVIGAEPTAPDFVAAQLEKPDYRDVYALLNQASMPESRISFTDVKANGLQNDPREGIDIEYQKVAKEIVFDGASNRHVSAQEYAAQYSAADGEYSRLLTALVSGLKTPGQSARQ